METENKLDWCNGAEIQERMFAVSRLFDLSLTGYINPQKKTDKFTHDLFVNFPVDLKSVQTPLFKAQDLYGIDPQYAITFNEKDFKRYKSLYPNIIVIFDINWIETEKRIGDVMYSVQPMHMTVAGFLADIKSAHIKSGCRTIEYQKRVNDTKGNAKTSYVLDARFLQKLSG
jgi:hypothetical protein